MHSTSKGTPYPRPFGSSASPPPSERSAHTSTGPPETRARYAASASFPMGPAEVLASISLFLSWGRRSAAGRVALLAAHGQHRTARGGHHARSHAAEEELRQPGSPMGADDDDVRLLRSGRAHDLFVRHAFQ